ncbi:MAG: prepilin-type N-terminal cleavage/methylation domain-containing protein [Gammaproteobacteria bacterium]|nr:prepilin-type N-terminal cleavage/methylation domain-containing protein [Gammaproteobacteria bacterium]
MKRLQQSGSNPRIALRFIRATPGSVAWMKHSEIQVIVPGLHFVSSGLRLLKTGKRQRGFTFIELITVVILVGVLSVLGGMLITTPIKSFVDLSRRAELVDIADNALQGMSRELRNALPNSVRVRSSGSRWALEFLHTSTGGRYRARQEAAGTGDPLSGAGIDTFDVLDGVIGVVTPGPAGQANCLNGSSDCLVIYNTGFGAGYFNAYSGDNIAAITAVGAGTLGYNNGAGWSFPFPIPPVATQRFYVVDKPISFVCDSSSGELRRYEDYGIGPIQPIAPGDFSVAGDLLADKLQSCIFNYAGSPSARHGLVTLRIEVSDVPTGESVALLYQVHVVNVP